MDAATLFLITMLASREAEQPLREYPSMTECQSFVDKAAKNRPARLANKRHECRRHYRISQ
jgi:hypothetical protein